MFTTDLQQVQYYDKYARWNPELGRRETWPETTARVMKFLSGVHNKHGVKASFDWHELEQAMLKLEVLPSMRVVQMAGPALDRCNVGAYNCSYLPLQDWQGFGELLYILMQGTGVGFSVEDRYVSQLPLIKPQGSYTIHGMKVVGDQVQFTIPDTTEGWCEALGLGLGVWAEGGDVNFDYSLIRPYGTPLLTKGGKASGPEPLKNLLEFARKLLLAHQGRKLSSLNVHDLACYCGSIVQVGGVRRAAEISLSDLGDKKLRAAKTGRFYELYPERMMANNSAVYTEKPPIGEFMDEWRELMDSGSGERGIFNRGGVNGLLPISRKGRDDWGLNPCGEIILRPFEFCNLSIAVARPDDTFNSLERKVKLATQFGVLQSLMTDFRYIRPEWAENCREERLLGVDITGQMDCPLLNDANVAGVIYAGLNETVYTEAKTLALQLGINMPVARTCVKPSGNSSQLLNVSSGLHPRFAPYYIRRLRIGASGPVAQFLISNGVPHHPEVGQPPDNPTVWVFEFPVESPAGAVCRKDMSALDQLTHWKICKEHWTEHNPSITVYVREDEWLEVGAWVYRNWNMVGGISFLPYDGGVYNLAPYEEISHDEYLRRKGVWPSLDFSKLTNYEHGDTTELNREFACTGDKCEI